jgi:quinol monooxygenase YgiN
MKNKYCKTVQYPCHDQVAMQHFVEAFKKTVLKSYVEDGNMISYCLSCNDQDSTVQLFSVWKDKETKDNAVLAVNDEMRLQIRPFMREKYSFVQGEVVLADGVDI